MKGCSTTHALIHLLHQVLEGLEESGSFARILMLDFSKCFDRIDHSILLDKLKNNGISPILVSWQRNFLTQRQQRVKLQKNKSTWCHINAGVPQGTLSGPEDFLNMVDDLTTCLNDIKYVDDTTIFEIVKPNQQSRLQKAADEVAAWAQKNNMKLNATKSKELFISFSQKEITISPIYINGEEIESVPCAKLLGVLLNNTLTWNDHIDSL